MTTVKVILKENKGNLRNEYPIYIRIIKDRKARFISTGKYIKKEHWNEKTSRIKKSLPNSVRLNAYLAQKVAEAEAVAVELETRSKTVSPNRIKEKIMGVSAIDFFSFADNYLRKYEARAAVGTYRSVKAIVEKLRQYCNNKPLFLDQITINFLKNYENHLRAGLGNSSNTVHNNFKKLNQVLNEAIREDLYDMQSNPFLRYKIRQQPSQRAYLTEDEIMLFEQMLLKEGSVKFHHRNMYVFCTYAGGIRISDLLKLKWSNFDGERIIFKIQKTGQPHSIKLPNKALEIIEYYKQFMKVETDFIFPGLKSRLDDSDPIALHNAISSATSLCNKSLRTIAKELNINKSISFHTSRHTFATRALRKGMRIEYVSKNMAHTKVAQTQIYTKIINAELEAAMDIFNS
ncbi:MAG: site-specific integrase [Bacteroidales bacterium]|nr:site-specific integrase [Bacteroidales bacterium]